jgi:predicted nucleotidyltransferase
MNQAYIRHIKEALVGIEYSKCILFGSQARGDAGPDSDYDLLLITEKELSQEEKFTLMDTIRNFIAPYLIPVDIIVQSEKEVTRNRKFAGSLVKNALAEGIGI